MKLRDLRISTKLNLVNGVLLIVTFVIVFSMVLTNFKDSSIKQAEDLAKEVAKSNANYVSNELEKAKTVLQEFENIILYARSTDGLNREEIIKLMEKTLEKQPSFLGIYTLWEPNIFDGKDKEYIEKKGHDSTGRFIPYVTRSDGQIILDKLVDYEIEGAGDYYQIPKKTKEVALIEPYYYEINGEDVLLTSLVVPVLDDKGNFMGIVGVDFDISFIQNLCESLTPFGGFTSLKTNLGVNVAHGFDKEKILYNVLEESDEWKTIIERTSKGESFTTFGVSDSMGVKVLRAFAPINIEGTDIYWTFECVSPEKNILSDYYSSFQTIVLIAAVALVFFMVIMFYITKRMFNPIKKALTMIKNMSKGNLQQRINADSKDEIGQMTTAMDEFADHLTNNVVGSMNLIASGNVNFDLETMGEDDEITPSLQTMVSTIKTLIEEMNYMSEQHDLGDIDVVVDENKFKDSYKELAKGMNNMVNGYKELNKKAMTCVEEFSNGNFEAELEKFPGKKAFINDAIEGLRENLKNVNKEIGTLVTASIEGNLDTRADETTFEGDWKELISGLNQLLNEIIEPIKEASNVLSEMANGNLQSRVVGDYKGDHAVIKNALNETLESLGTYIQEISNVLSEMSNSNLDLEIVNDYKGDFAPIKDGLNLIINTFNSILFDMNNAAEQVASGAGQVSDGSNELSQGATEQASSIEELTSSIAQVASQTKQNASNAGEANNLALEAKTDAEEGNHQMKQMLDSMDEINEASNNIAKIIKVIDEIAFQTNILALNAAVEAARAGQHGKGFAVVAEEVRNLAQRSANAAQETTDLIEGSMKKVEIGTDIANKTAEALEKIVDGVSKASDLVGQIAEASNEQATGITQINQGIEQVAKVTQTNSATAEESAAASEELSSQAGLLKEMVSQFNIKNNSNSQTVKALPGKVQLDEAAVTSDKPQINLTDDEFGKY